MPASPGRRIARRWAYWLSRELEIANSRHDDLEPEEVRDLAHAVADILIRLPYDFDLARFYASIGLTKEGEVIPRRGTPAPQP